MTAGARPGGGCRYNDDVSLRAGARLGVYHVLGPIGAGGMGEVFRARDLTLQREVALKSLPDSFVTDRNRVAVGPLFFESPTGAWERGTYALVIRHEKGVAHLPINLE